MHWPFRSARRRRRRRSVEARRSERELRFWSADWTIRLAVRVLALALLAAVVGSCIVTIIHGRVPGYELGLIFGVVVRVASP